jgi:dihydropyrimidine dehydrogenase (NADP+)/dihydropyrimidine dehydrogenase (NAD+) subunit PreA
MKFGYPIVKQMQDQLLAFMERHQFERLENFKGHSVQFFTTHADLVQRQAEARAVKQAQHKRETMVRADAEWDGNEFVKQSEALARG